MTAIPEVVAAEKIADLLDKHQDPRWFTPAALQYLGRKVVGYRNAIRPILDELDADPKRLPDRGLVLRQQATSSLSDEDHILERLHHLKAEESYLNACLTAMGSRYVDASFDPDQREQDHEDDRDREERQAERGAREAVRP